MYCRAPSPLPKYSQLRPTSCLATANSQLRPTSCLATACYGPDRHTMHLQLTVNRHSIPPLHATSSPTAQGSPNASTPARPAPPPRRGAARRGAAGDTAAPQRRSSAPCVSSSCPASAGSSSGLFAATSMRPPAAARAWRARSCTSHACAAPGGLRPSGPQCRRLARLQQPQVQAWLFATDACRRSAERKSTRKLPEQAAMRPSASQERAGGRQRRASRTLQQGRAAPCGRARLREVARERGGERKHDRRAQQQRAQTRARRRARRVGPARAAVGAQRLRRMAQQRPAGRAARRAHAGLQRDLQRHHLHKSWSKGLQHDHVGVHSAARARTAAQQAARTPRHGTLCARDGRERRRKRSSGV